MVEWETEKLLREGRWEVFVPVILELVLELWAGLLERHLRQGELEHCLLGEEQKRVE